MTIMKPLLSIEHLEITYQTAEEVIPLVKNVSFQLYQGEMAALIGSSGCGKSLTAHAIVGLLEQGYKVTNGEIYYKNQNILHNDDESWHYLRREEIGLVIQDSLNGLNPIRTVKKQMVETLKQKRKWLKKEMNVYLHSLLNQVGFTNPESILSSYPFELSGGMRQRVLLAMMISLKPKLLIADEPTTALDVINREKVLTLLKKLKHECNLTILLISHDHETINKFADRVIRMDQGGIIT